MNQNSYNVVVLSKKKKHTHTQKNKNTNFFLSIKRLLHFCHLSSFLQQSCGRGKMVIFSLWHFSMINQK